MSKISQSKFWFWGFIILIIINISAISSMIYIGNRIHNPEYREDIPKDFRSERGRFKNNHRQHPYISALDLSDDQRSFYIKTKKEHVENMRLLKNDLEQNQATLFDEISKSEPDSAMIVELKKANIKSQQAIIDETIRFIDTLKTELDESQVKALNHMIGQRFRGRRFNR
jgi:hypothetical protein